MELKITPSGQTIVKPTALGPVANTDTKLLIYGLFQKGRVLAQDGVVGDVHTNSIENVWSLFKRSIMGAFHKISTKHLDRYLEELEWRFNNRKTRTSSETPCGASLRPTT